MSCCYFHAYPVASQAKILADGHDWQRVGDAVRRENSDPYGAL
jgi:hypothetical protein